MGNPLVSISVPVYNVERYLTKCLDSLINQTLKEIEVILVDDGSTDSSGTICDQYAEKDLRIKVIHKKNGGLASARQAALELATGDYFCACDADDWVEASMYEKLYESARETKADVVMCNYYQNHSSKGVKKITIDYESMQRKDFLSEILLGHFPHMVWNKLFKRSLFQKYRLKWEVGINQGEDMLIMMKLFQAPISVVMIQDTLYHYRIVESGNSYTQNITLSTFYQSRWVMKWAEQNIKENKYKKGIMHMKVNLSITGLRVRDGMTPQLYNKMVMKELSIKQILKYEGITVKSIVALLTILFGYNFGRVLIKKFY